MGSITNQTNTIFALASGRSRAGIAVIRVSGPGAKLALKSLAGKIPPARALTLSALKVPGTQETLDHALIAWFPGPHSFTGEDMAEFHVHGSVAVIDGLLKAFEALEGFQPAEPGAFSRRAFEGGKLDLMEIEGLADLIDAETEAQRRQAIKQMEGALGALYESWRQELITLLAHMEALLDFPDEEDAPIELDRDWHDRLACVLKDVETHLDDDRQGERLREGLRVVIAGAPNVGKSSLMNYLAQRDAAIVSTQAGTTRDVIETHLNLGGYPVILVDTAGIRDDGDEIEREGIARAQSQTRQADIVLWLSVPGSEDKEPSIGDMPSEVKILPILNKADLIKSSQQKPGSDVVCTISVKTGQGIKELLSVLTKQAKSLVGSGHEMVLTRARHRMALQECAEHLRQTLAQDVHAQELSAEDLRLATRALGRITGRVDVEAVLDQLFSGFCIGK